ncbi:rRNA-processing protein EBP2, putative [Plasmodium yoelii]|nr:rRNA-processing protein EBP2, putative [Plasmodium yoelii]CDU16723.1 nucleolar preribosomal assembly protein, putative [Plasmodium yoelii]VTZ74272.1 rRNA-processing protein EBP2, putative [Plasmodium yoelii]|eukprot:XP_725978.2 rRNA-processing protein EBP2, putative [Plasmodium yoelii]
MKDDNIMDIEKKKNKLKKKKNVLQDSKKIKNKKIKNSILSNNDDNQFIKQAMKQIKLLKNKKSEDEIIVNKKIKKSKKGDKISKTKEILPYNDNSVVNIKNVLRKKIKELKINVDNNIYNDEKEILPKFSENKKLLKKKLKEIKINVDSENNEWLEKLDLTCSENFYIKKINLFGKCDIRENEFIKFAHTNVLKCLQKLQNLNIPFNRPYDFLAEMLKTDIHMEKVRSHILKNHEMSENKEKNKLKRLNKKFNKNGGSMKVLDQKKAIEKKKNLAKIEQFKNNLENLNVHDFFQKHSKDVDQNDVKNKKTKNKHIQKGGNKNKHNEKGSNKNKHIERGGNKNKHNEKGGNKNKHIEKGSNKNSGSGKNKLDKDTKSGYQKSIKRPNKIKHKFLSKGKNGGKNRKKKKFKRR